MRPMSSSQWQLPVPPSTRVLGQRWEAVNVASSSTSLQICWSVMRKSLLNLKPWTTASLSSSPATPMCLCPSVTSGILPAGPTRFTARPSPLPLTTSRTLSMSPSVYAARLSPGTSLCLWQRGSLPQPSRPVTLLCSSSPSKLHSPDSSWESSSRRPVSPKVSSTSSQDTVKLQERLFRNTGMLTRLPSPAPLKSVSTLWKLLQRPTSSA
mmetsp:Transcript_25564/g.31019  ORF Transcript_25564/g.31019 Transcript_25564/m.31019 type:complete len:210 (+) Transcript_25564:327-956(+)